MFLELRKEKKFDSHSRFLQSTKGGGLSQTAKCCSSGQIKAIKINAYMITRMLDFTAQRKFSYVFR